MKKMESFLSINDIAKTLECAICLDVVRNPRRLTCEHYFCKECLDNLLKFDREGNCTIQCPKQCAKKTAISKNETTNDLGIDYMMKGILDMVASKTSSSPPLQKPTCQAKAECKKEIADYCPSCNYFLCINCACSHDRNKYFRVTYSEHDGRINCVCKEHLADVKWMCCHCNDGELCICIYCANRGHAGHAFKTIETLAQELREKLEKEVTDITELGKITEKSFNQSVSDVDTAIGILTETLQYRKLLCLDKYMEKLDKEEERIHTEFDKIVKTHWKQYVFKDTRNFCRESIAKEDIMLVMQTKNILKNISASKFKGTVLEETVTLSGCDFTSSQPLGNIGVTPGGRVAIDGISKSFKYHLSSPVELEDAEELKLNMFNTLQSRIRNSFEAIIKECIDSNTVEKENEEGLSRIRSSYHSYTENILKEQNKQKLFSFQGFSAWTIQGWWRKILTRLPERVSTNDAAIVIQKAWRKHKEETRAQRSAIDYHIPKKRKFK